MSIIFKLIKLYHPNFPLIKTLAAFIQKGRKAYHSDCVQITVDNII